MATPGEVLRDPKFWNLPAVERRKVMVNLDSRFAALPEGEQNKVIKAEQPESSSSGRPPKEGFFEGVGKDLSIGFRSGVSDVAHTASNIIRPIAPGAAESVEKFAKLESPTAEEVSGREGMGHMVVQGVGSLLPEALKYAPAMASKRFAPLVAGATEAIGAADKGVIPALEAGAKGAASFYLMGRAQELPSRLGRAAGSAVAMAAPAAIESGGDVQKTGSALILGGVLGAASGKPAKAAQPKLLEAANSFKDDVAKTFAPGLRAKEGKLTEEIARPHLAKQAQSADRAEYALREAREYFDLTKPDKALLGLSPEGYKFIQNIESGNIQNIDPKWRPFAQTIRKAFDDRYAELNKEGLINTFIDNYFPHLWKRPDRAAQVFQVLGKRPFEGPKSFLKQRKFASLKEGIDFALQNPQYGLEPAKTNPIDMALLKMREMDRLLTARHILKEMKQGGLVRYFSSADRAPKGWAKIDDKVSTVTYRDPKTRQLVVAGNLYGPEPAVRVINNHLSPGLRSKEWFNTLNTAANSLNQFQLGWSAFHLGFTTMDATISNFALGLEKIASGRVLSGAKEIAASPFRALEPLATIPAQKLLGTKPGFSSQLLEELLSPGRHPQVAPLVEYARQAGARIQLDPFYKTEIARNLREAWRQGNYVAAALKVPGALTEKASQWMMSEIVPRQKIAAFARLAEFEIERLGPQASKEQIRRAMQLAWDSIDNRMGQLVYDNLFWNKTAKDLVMLSVRSVGWNLGTFRELGGAAVDLATIRSRMASGDPILTHKLAYAVSLPVVVGTIGAITYKLNTGKNPEGAIDLFFPKTGKQDEYGRDERINFPSYIKDIYHWAHAPIRTATGKMHPMISTIADMLANKDWQGQKIYNEDDPLVQEILDGIKYVGQQARPFAARYTIQDLKSESKGGAGRYTTGERLGAFVGITPAPADIKKSDAEQYLDKKVQETTPAGGRTKGTSKRFDRIREIERAIRLHQDPSKIIQQGLELGEISENDIKTAQDRAASDPLVRKFNRAQWQDALKAYELALGDERVTREELSQMRELVQDKVYRNVEKVLALPVKDRDRVRILSKISRLGLKLGTEESGTAPPPGTE